MDFEFFHIFMVFLAIVFVRNIAAHPGSKLNYNQQEWRRSGSKVDGILTKIASDHLSKEGPGHKNHKRLKLSSVQSIFGSIQNPPTSIIPGVSMIPPVTQTDLKGFSVMRKIGTLSLLCMQPRPTYFNGMKAVSYITGALSITSVLNMAITLAGNSFELTAYAEAMLSNTSSDKLQIVNITKNRKGTLVTILIK